MTYPTSDEVAFLVKPVGAQAREVSISRQAWGEIEAEFLRLGHAPSLRARLALEVEGEIEWLTHQDGRRASRVRKVA